MNSQNTIAKMNTNVKLSTLWIFVTVNYIFCDVVTLMNPEDLKQIITGTVGDLQMTEGFLLGAAILMEIPFAMILLARFLPYRANRWANIIAGTIMTVVQVASLFVGGGLTLHYIFYSIIEIACTAIIVWVAWRWRNPEDHPNTTT